MTREEQLAAARTFAKRNPDWRWDESDFSLRELTRFDRPVVNLPLNSSEWCAWHFGYLVSCKHASLSQAFRVLGIKANA